MKTSFLQLRGIHPLAWTIIVGTLFGRMATSMSIPFLSIYLTQSLGASPTQTGITVAVSSLVGVFASFYGGYISDRIGRKKVMILSIAGWSIVFFAFAASNQIWMFFIVNTLNGLCRSLFEPTSRALLSEVTPQEQKLLIFNMRYTAINIGVVFGPLLGLWFSTNGSSSSFIMAGCIYVLYTVVLMFQFGKHPIHIESNSTTEQRITLKKALRVISQDRIFLYILIGTTFCVLGYGHLNSTLPPYLALVPDLHNGATWFAYMLTLNAITVLVVQYPLVKWASRFAPVVSLIIGNIFVATSLLLYGLASTGLAFMIITVIFTIGEVLLFTMMDMLIDRIAKPEWKGTYFGTIGFNNLGNVCAPILGGFLLDVKGAQHSMHIFVPLALTCALGLPFLIAAYRRMNLSYKQ